MGTRGLYGLKINNEYYLSYNGYDSYPYGLGKFFFNFINNSDLDKLKNNLLNIRNIFFDNSEPDLLTNEISKLTGINNKELLEKKIHQYDEKVSNSRNIFKLILNNELDFFINDSAFMDDKLFCEWVHYYDYDNEVFVSIQNSYGNIGEIKLNENYLDKVDRIF